MARDYYNEVTNKNSFSKNTQKKKKKNEKETEVVKKPQSSVSTKQPVRQTDTGTGSRRTASVSRGSQQAANQVTNAASQVMQRRSDTNKPAQTAKEMMQQRKGVSAAIEQKQSVQNKLNTNRLARTEAEEAKKKNYAEWETVKNKSKQDQQAWFTEKAKETADRHNIKGTDNLATSAALAGFHGAKGAVHSLSGALERASMNDTAEAYRFKFDEMRKGKSEDIAEKIGAEKAQKRQEARLAGYREKTKIEQQKIEELKAQEEERDNLKFTIGGKEYSPRKMTVGAATFTGQRLVDSATGPYSLLSMGARVLEDERNSGKERNDQLKQKLAESGQFSQEELDEQFAQLDKRAVANAYASSAIEILSELMFQGVGLSKKYIPEGASGLLDKVAGKLFGRLGSTAAGRIGLGIGEETLEEWIANPIQAKVSNMLTGNTLQSLQEESVRKTYQEQARSLEEIQATSADINSEAFLEKAKEVYKEAGASDAEASQIAELARDYFNAEITGDSSTAEEKLNEITNILAGGENDLREKWTLQDALEVAGEMIISVGAEAAPGAISMSQTGGQYKANYGIEGVRKLAKVVENLDDEKSDRAKAIIDDIDNGKDVSNTQVAMLMEWSNNAALKAQDREITRDQVVQRRMRDEKLYVPIVDAEYNLAPATEARFEEITETVADLAQEALNMSDVDAYAIGDVVAAYETGTISAEQMNELNIENPENRAVFEKATGIDLGQYTIKDAAGNVKVAASNTAMQKALFAKAADNYIESAKIEQENWNDVERGQAYERLTSDNMGGRGDMAIDKVLSSVDPRNRGEFMLAGSVARRVYEHARLTNDSWDEVKKDFTNTFGPAMTENMKYVYEMAKADKAIGETKNYGKKVNAGENMKNSLGDDRVVIVPGKVIDERQNQKLSDKSFALLIATTFGKNVKLVDSLPLTDNKGRVVYKNNQNGERITEDQLNKLSEEERIYYSPVQVEGSQSGTAITINMHPDIFRDWKEVLGHEAFHQIRENAPEEVKAMARILMDQLYKADPEGFTQMLNAKIEQYKIANPEITAEEAFEEILANNFANIDWNQLVEDIKADPAIEDNATFFDNLKKAFAELLRKLRSMLSLGDISSEQARNDLMDEILACDETYQMLVKAARAASSAQATEAINETQDQINVASQATNLSSDDNIMNREDIESTLKENFDEYKEDETNLRIATDAIDALQHFRFSIGNNTAQRGNKRGPEQIRTIAKGITTQFLNEGYINFIGQKVNSPEDLACLCQVLRDPRFETFRVFLTKGNKIVSVQSVSSRLPGQSRIHKEKDTQTHYDVIKDRMQRTGADGYYLMHNHPSGNVGASMADLSMSAYAIQALGSSGYKGHIILDHDKFGLIEDIPTRYSNGMVLPSAKEVAMIGQQTIDLIHEPEIDHQMLGEKISNPNDLARIGQFVNTSNDVSVLIYLSADRKVRGIQEISNKTIANNKEIKGYIRNQAVDFGSPTAALFTNSQDQNVERAVMDLYQQGVFLDAITGNVLGSLKTMRIAQVGDPRQMGITDADIFKRTKVYEPTEDTDIRFSLSEPVERVKDLIAVHNLKPTDISNAFKLGGFPMPSIAVTKDSMGHELYGDITLMFHSDTIDPKASRDNQVFGGDAWTPTFPAVKKLYSRKKADEIAGKLKDILGIKNEYKDLPKGIRFPDFDQENLSDKLDYTTPGEAYTHGSGSEVMKLAYLKNAKNFDVAIPMKEGSIRNLDRQALEHLDDKLPELTYDDIFDTVQRTMEYEPLVREARKAYYESKGNAKLLKALAKDLDKEMGYSEVHSRLEALIKYRTEGMPEVIDQSKFDKILSDNIDIEEYKQWVDDLYEGIVEKEGIRNNKDLFLPSGNRRSWESLHDPVTLDNVVSIMRKELAAGSNGLFGANPKGAAQKSYKSLDEIRADEDRLQMLPEDEYEALGEAATQKLVEVCQDIVAANPKHFDNRFGAVLDTGEYIAEILNKTRNKAEIKRRLKTDYWLDVSDEQMDSLMEAIEAIANVPTGYFEAKPRRAVGFNEVKAAIIPSELKWTDGLYDEIRSELELMEIPIYEYDYSKEGDRQRVVNEAATEQDLRFSISEDSNGRSLTESQQMFFNNSKVLDDEGRLKVMYHGTPNIGFTVFDYSKAKPGTLGRGFYFTDTPSHAGVYGQSIEVYLNITNPLTSGTNNITKDQLRAFVERLAEDEDYGIENYGYGSTVDSVTESVWGGTDFQMLHDLNLSCVGDLAEACRIFNEVNGTDYDGIITPVETLAMRPEQIKFTDNLDPTSDIDMRYSLDDEYMAAVESGDMETAQKLVDIAAKEAGYNIKAYHGTAEDFNKFSRAKWGAEHKGYLEYGAGFYFTPSENEADRWAKRGRSGYAGKDTKVMSVYLSSERAIKADDPIPGGSRVLQNMGLAEADANFIAARTYRFINYLLEDKGFDNVEVQDELKSLGFDAVDATYGEWVGKPEGQFVVFDPEQIKSADAVTYAEDGSVIPLSQRFDPTNNDIRYSLPTQDTNGKVLSDGQMEYFKNSQARGEGGKLVPVYHTTRKGGFTVFDPEHSDDKRSLFFASNWFVSQTYARNAYNPIDLNRRDKDQDVTLEEFLSMDQEHGAPGLVATRIIDIVDTETGEVLYDNSNFAETGNALVEWYNAAREGKAKKNVGVTVGGELMDYEGFVSWMNNTMDEWYGRGTQRGYYSCYLNLVNPMMVDANYSYWNSIPFSPGASMEEVIEKLNHYAGYKISRVSGFYQLNGSKYHLIVEGARQDFSTRTWTPFKIDEEFSFDIDEVLAKGNTVNLQHALEDIWFKEFGNKPYDHMEIFFESLLDDLRLTQRINWSSKLEERDFGGAYFTSDGFRLWPNDYGYREKRYTTRQLAEIAQDNGYDGVIIRNCYDLSNTASFKGESRLSDIYIAFSAEQIKDTNNLDPTNNPDIRYSVVDDDEAMSYAAHDDAYDDSWEAMEYYESVLSRMVDVDLDDGFINHPMQVFLDNLRKYGETDAKAKRGKDKSKYRQTKFKNEEDWTEAFYEGLTWQANEMRFDDPVLEEGRTRMAKSRNDFFNSTVAKWNQGWVTEGSVLDINSIKKPVRDLVAATMQGSDTDRKYNSDTVKKTLIDMRLAYWYAQQGRIEIADALLWHTAHRMIENVEFYADDSVFNEYKELRQYLRTTRIQLGEEYWADVDYQAFRKANFGRLKLVSGETNVDQIYAELEELFPGLFNSEEYTTPPDQLMHMAAVLDSIQPYKEAYSSEECAALATEIASDLLDIMQNEGQALESVADKYEAKIQAMRTRHAEAMLKVREQRDRGIKAEKAKFKEYVAKQKEKTLHKKHYQSIQKNYKKLTERLLTNTADKNIPEQYKKELAKLLGAFDLQTVGSKKYEARTGRKSQKTIRMGAMVAALSNIESKSGEFHVNDAITDIIDELLGKDVGNGHNRSIEGLTIDELNSSELARIDNLLKALLHEFNTYKTVKVKAKRQQVEDIGKAQVDSALKHAEDFGFGKDYNGAVGILDKIVNLDEMTASYLFRRIDPENEGLGLMYRELRLSFDHYVRNTAQLNQWMEQILGKYQNRGKGPRKYGSDQIDQWRSFNYARTLNLENGSVQLTPAQMMSIYCLAKRPQAYNHMTGAGIVVAPNRYDAKFINDIKQKVSTALPVKLTDADIKLIENELTPDQMKVASDLQQLMANQMAAWGNEASMNVLGIELFNEPDYFPIKSDRAALISDLSEDQFAEAIRSFGFTKAVQPGAKNAIMVDDIFAVVAEHCNNMNLYNSYSEAINDFMKVYNYRDVDESRGEYTVKQAIAHAYSQKATAFIGRFIKDLNGNVSGNDTGINKMYNDLLSKAKKASVFANGRVALQQPTAIARAFYVINPKYLKGIVTNEKAVQGAMQEMFEHCPIALWKSWGYYDIQMGRSVEDVMMNNGNWFEDLETDLYGRLDNITWTAIWQMVKAEMKDTHPDVKPGTDEYWELCNERMSEVVDLTQVVDSPMHRSHAMRAKDYVSKTATAFMAEPTLTFNMVKDGLIQAKEALQKGDKAKAGSIFAKTMGVFFLQAALVSAMAAIWDAVRGKNPSGDDDDEKSRFTLWWLNTLENFKGELAIWNKVYFVKDISSLFQGYGVNNMALQGWKSVADGCAQLFGIRNVYSSKKWYENLLTGAGYITGQPYGTLFKDLKAIYNMFGLDWEVFNSIGGYLDETQDKFSEMFGKKDEDSMAAGFWAVFDGKKNGASSQEGEKGSKSSKKKSSGSEEETAEDIKSLSEDQLKKLDKKAAEKAKGYTGPDRDEVLWDVLSEGYTKHIEAGDMDYIYKLRVLYQQHGGNIDTFNTKVANAMPSIYKKTFKANMTEEEISNQEEMKEFMLRYGMSEAEVSDICYHTDMAKDLKAALRMNNREYIMDELVPLIRAGLTREDFERLYKNRNRGANTYSGKYTDEKYRRSTGNFVWPTQGTITSGFGYRESPTAGASSQHMGIDIGAAQGTPVVACDGGVVIEAGSNGGYGNSVGIQHDDGTISYYNHLYNWNVQVGDQVGQGQQIGQVGSTGISTGPHLDFRLYKDGEYLNPEEYLNKRS